MAKQNDTTGITKLLKELAATKDQDSKKKIRRTLRALGHKGGLNHKGATGPKKAKPAKKTAAQNRKQGRKEQEAYRTAKKVVTQEEYEAANG